MVYRFTRRCTVLKAVIQNGENHNNDIDIDIDLDIDVDIDIYIYISIYMLVPL